MISLYVAKKRIKKNSTEINLLQNKNLIFFLENYTNFK